MADRLRIVYFTAGGSPVTELDLNSGNPFTLVRDTLTFTPPAAQSISARSNARFGGSRVVGESHDNGSLAFEVYVNPNTTANGSVDAYETLVESIYSLDRERYIEWRPDGGSYSVFWELRGPGTHAPKYRWIEFQSTKTLNAAVSFGTAPLAEGARMGITDPFDSATTLTDNWTYVSGGGNGDTVGSGLLTPGATNPTTKRVLSFTERGYTTREGQVDVVFVGPTAASTSSLQVSAHLAQDGSNLLEARVSDNGTNSQLGIYRNGTLLGSATNLSARIGSSERYLLRMQIEGNVVTAYVVALSGNAPAAHRSAYYTANAGWRGTATATLTAGTQNPVDGYSGLSFTQQGASNGLAIEEFDYRPFVRYSAGALPTETTFPLSPSNAGAFKALPGDAPPRFSFSVGGQNTPNAAAFGLLGWYSTPKAYNLVANGNFEDNGSANYINGWLGTGLTNQSGTSTLASDSTAGIAKFASRTLHVTTPATLNSGAGARVYGTFRKGRTYTFKAWVRLGTSTSTTVQAAISNGTDSNTSAAITPSTTWQQVSVTLTPTVDSSIIDIVLRVTAATASTFRVDGVQLYDSSHGDPVTGPTGTQAEGFGALPPLGLIHAVQSEQNLSSNWTQTVDAAALSGAKMQLGTPTANVAYPLTFTVDPNLVSSDDYTQGELSIEVWARVYIPSTYVNPYFILSSTPSYTSGQTVPTRYSEEWQGFGKVIPVPTVSRWAIVRLGTLTFPQDQTAQRSAIYDAFVRQYLTVSLVAGTGSTGNAAVDYLACVPSRNRASTPSNKALDASYPDFLGTVGASTATDAIKFVDTNLAGEFSAPGQHGRFSPDLGLGGAQLVIPRPNRTNFLLLASNIVPDNPGDYSTADALYTASPSSLYVDVIPRYYFGRGT